MQKKNLFLNETAMKAASIIAAGCGIVSLILMALYKDLTVLTLFEELVKIILAIGLYIAFSRFHWDFMRGLMGAMFFALLYQEGYHVLGQLWGETSDFDSYLIMGVQGSLYLAAFTMSFMMTIIITVNHFILEYSHAGNRFNMIFNQISILFKILLYVMLLVINCYLALPSVQLIYSGIGYVGDLAIIVMVICIESQLDDFKKLKHELQDAKKAGASHE